MNIITISREFGSGGRELGKQLSDYLHFSYYTTFKYQNTKVELLLKQQQIIKRLAQKGSCIIVGLAADVILREYNPINLFIYADTTIKVSRCRKYADENENLTVHELEMKIKQVDCYRKQYYKLLMGRKWGAKENYHLCVNTSEIEIKKVSSILSEYAQNWFRRKEN